MATEKSPLLSKGRDAEDNESVHSTDSQREDVHGPAATAVIYLTAIAVSAQGASALATQYFLKDIFLMGPADVSFWLSFHSVGWVIKPLWGFISDTYPILNQRRRPYLILVSGVAALAFLSYGLVENIWHFLCVLIISHACMSFLTVIAQALLVQRSGKKKIDSASFNFTSYFGIKVLASAAVTFMAGMLLDWQSARHVLMLCASLFVFVLMTAPWMSESNTAPRLSPHEQCKVIAELFRRKEVWGVTLYIFVFCAMPNAASAMFFFNVDVLHFTARFIAIISVASSAAQIVGLMVYHRWLNRVPFRALFAAATLLCALVSCTPLIQVFRLNRRWGIDDHVFALVDTFVIMAVLEVLWIPMLVLASRLCPPAVEGTSFALFLSIHNMGLWMSGALSALLITALGITRDSLENLWILIVICSCTMLIPLFLLPFLPSEDPEALRDRVDAGP